MKVQAAGATKPQMETAMQKTLASTFGVKPSQVTLIVTRVTTSEIIEFTIGHLDADKFKNVESTAQKISKDPSLMKKDMAKQLKDAGATSVTENSITVSSFSKKRTTVTTANFAYRMTIHLSIIIVLLTTAFMQPDTP